MAQDVTLFHKKIVVSEESSLLTEGCAATYWKSSYMSKIPCSVNLLEFN